MNKCEKFKISPTIEEIKMIDSNRYCPVTECKKLFTNLSTFVLHLRHHLNVHQSHKQNKKDNTESTIQFHCPVDGCVYTEISQRFFKTMKHLRQHFWKVHADRKFICEKCKKGFSQKTFLDAHLRECNKIYKCECGATYPSYEGLLTHARRKQHPVPEELLKSRSNGKEKSKHTKSEENKEVTKMQPLVIVINAKPEPTLPIDEINRVFRPRLLLPKPAPLNSLPLPTVAAIALSELSDFREIATKSTAFTQTENKVACGDCSHCTLSVLDSKTRHFKKPVGCSIKRSATVPMESNFSKSREFSTGNTRNTKRLRRTTETQTRANNRKQGKTCAETQTGGEYILEKAMAVAELPILKLNNEEPTESTCPNSDEQSSIEISSTVNEFCETANICEQFVPNSESIFEFGTPSSTSRRESLQAAPLLPSVTAVDSFTEMPSETQVCSPILNHSENGNSGSEKDVLLGVVNHPFTLNQTCKNNLSNSQSNEMFSSGSLQDCRNMNKRCSSFSYDGLFDSRPCDSPKLGEILRFSIETQTELDLDNLLLGEESDSNDSILCFNIQTQTSDDLESIPYDQLLTNMQTQTTEEYLFPELSFSDIQTQTTWNDILPLTDVSNQAPLVHIQTQTNVANSEIQSANSETQTFLDSYDSNCAELTDSHTQTTWSCLQDLVSGL